jgi:hypothetical protein
MEDGVLGESYGGHVIHLEVRRCDLFSSDVAEQTRKTDPLTHSGGRCNVLCLT